MKSKNEEIKASDPLAKMAIVAQAICRMDRNILYQDVNWQLQGSRRELFKEMRDEIKDIWKTTQEKS